MPGPGGGPNSGGFGGGIYEGKPIPEFGFDSVIDIYISIQNTFAELWFDLNKPAYDMLQDVANGDGEGVVSHFFDGIFEVIALSNFDEFLNQFTLLQFLFGSGLILLLSYRFLKFFKI